MAKTTAEKIAVMQAYEDGKTIVVSVRSGNYPTEFKKSETHADAIWNWQSYDYAVKQEPDSIDWGNVAQEWRFMARDSDGEVWFYQNRPTAWGASWTTDGEVTRARSHASLKVGDIDWRKSLLGRPA